MKNIKIIGSSIILIALIVVNLFVSFSFEKQNDATLKLLVSQATANSEEEYGNGQSGSCFTCVYANGGVGVEIGCQSLPNSSCTFTSCGGGFC